MKVKGEFLFQTSIRRVLEVCFVIIGAAIFQSQLLFHVTVTQEGITTDKLEEEEGNICMNNILLGNEKEETE